MKNIFRPALVLFFVLTLLTGVAYPLAVTGVARLLFPDQAGGSLILRGGKPVGSSLIGQNFTDPGHFWSRPSATGPMPYNASASGGSNLGPLNEDLATRVAESATAIRAEDGAGAIPADAVTTSASGLDPDISPAYARLQAQLVATARGVPVQEVQSVIDQNTHGPLLGFIGQPTVNVLMTNRAIDARFPAR